MEDISLGAIPTGDTYHSWSCHKPIKITHFPLNRFWCADSPSAENVKIYSDSPLYYPMLEIEEVVIERRTYPSNFKLSMISTFNIKMNLIFQLLALWH